MIKRKNNTITNVNPCCLRIKILKFYTSRVVTQMEKLSYLGLRIDKLKLPIIKWLHIFLNDFEPQNFFPSA